MGSWRLRPDRRSRKSKKSNGRCHRSSSSSCCSRRRHHRLLGRRQPPLNSRTTIPTAGGGLRGEKGWLNGLLVKLNYESNISCSVGASAAEPIDVWARAGIGTRWLVAIEDAGRHGHPGGERFPPFGTDSASSWATLRFIF